MSRSPKRLMIVTGEASGDMHGAKLIKAFNALMPEARFIGAGGSLMSSAGCEILVPGEDLAVMGIVEVIEHFPVIRRAFNKLKGILHGDDKPDALVLIDFPEFNLRLAKQAQLAGVPVLYYVSPQVWAWRRGRVKKIARIVDSLAAIFPFEPDLYKGLDINVQYVGHPLLDEYSVADEPFDLYGKFGIDRKKRIVGLFPGSRQNELKYMLETIVSAAGSIHARIVDTHFILPVADTLDEEKIAEHFPDDLPITFVKTSDASIYDIAGSCEAVLTVSGTVTLQTALVGTPMVILYKVAAATYAIGKRLVKVDHIGLANIVAGNRVVPELIQDEASPENLADEIVKLLSDHEYAMSVRKNLSVVRERLGSPGCSERVARMLLEMLEGASEIKHV